jgi:hypothetical protein
MISEDERDLIRAEVAQQLQDALVQQQVLFAASQNAVLDKLARQFDALAAQVRALSGLNAEELRRGMIQVKLPCPVCGEIAQGTFLASKQGRCKITCKSCGSLVYCK